MLGIAILVRFLFNDQKKVESKYFVPVSCWVYCNFTNNVDPRNLPVTAKIFVLCYCAARQNRILLSKMHRVSTSCKEPNVQREAFKIIWSMLLVGALSWFHCYSLSFSVALIGLFSYF